MESNSGKPPYIVWKFFMGVKMKFFTKCLVVLAVLGMFSVAGCARIDPLSPKTRQAIQNQNGKIDELKTNQNGVVNEMLKLKQDQEIIARDMDKVQTGINNKQNTGVQIFQGDGALITVIVLAGIAAILVGTLVHYKQKSDKNEKVANILAMQIAQRGDVDLDNQVFMAALNSDVEREVYHLVLRHQNTLRKSARG
jgi:predicted PurR-regulated permease PerM